jgi:hypothetical protein
MDEVGAAYDDVCKRVIEHLGPSHRSGGVDPRVHVGAKFMQMKRAWVVSGHGRGLRVTVDAGRSGCVFIEAWSQNPGCDVQRIELTVRRNWLIAMETAGQMTGLLGGESADEVGVVASAG